MILTTTFGRFSLSTNAERSFNDLVMVLTLLDGLMSMSNRSASCDSLPVVRREKDLLLRADDNVSVMLHDVGDERDNGQRHCRGRA